MAEYRVRVDKLGETSVTRDDVAGVTRIEFRDRHQRAIVELPDVHGPDLAIALANQLIRCVDRMGYGHEIIPPRPIGGAA